MLSEESQKNIFAEGEYKGKIASEMLNHYLVIQYMDYLIGSTWTTQEDKIIYKELINYANKKYDWVKYIVKNEKIIL